MEIRSGDELAFRQVYNEVFPVVMKVAYHVTYNQDVAEDICQDAFIRFYDKDMSFPSMDDDGSSIKTMPVRTLRLGKTAGLTPSIQARANRSVKSRKDTGMFLSIAKQRH